MSFSTLIKTSFKNLRRNLKRSILTMLGIIIGIAAVITIVALGEAYKTKTIENFTGKKKDAIVLTARFSYNDIENGSHNRSESTFNDRDGKLISSKKYVESYELLKNDQSFGTFVTADLRGKNIQGVVGSVKKTLDEPIIGRNIKELDNDRLQKVVVIKEDILPKNSDLKKYLNGILTIKNVNYRIIGIIPKNEDANVSLFSFNANIKVPEKTFEKYGDIDKAIRAMKIVLKKDSDVKASIKDIEKTLNENGSKREKGNYEVFDNSGIIKALGSVLNIITTFIAIVAGISLFIAGIGVMNMIYTSVSERTLEIGIKRALGAKKRDIKREFFLEGIVITLSGGAIGYILGMIIAAISSIFLKLTVKPSLLTVFIAVAVSVVVGIVSSYLPAKKAANQNTIDILK